MPLQVSRYFDIHKLTFVLLCLAALLFPFSVAATNLLMALVIVLGIASGAFHAGVKLLRNDAGPVALALVAYLGLLVVGLLWSADQSYGLEVVGHYWFWLALPVILSVAEYPGQRKIFLTSLSVGLLLHLLLCVIQWFGLYHVNLAGSNADDATGHIGHIGFGFIYGVWAAWLLDMGWQSRDRIRWIYWGCAIWSWVMIFVAQGRAGYIVAAILMIFVFFKRVKLTVRSTVAVTLFLALVSLITLSSETGRQRLDTSIMHIQGVFSGDVSAADPRFSYWLIALEAWKRSPVLGVGTGGFPEASKDICEEHPELKYSPEAQPPGNPHNTYLLSLSRWGPLGLILVFGVIGGWLLQGRRQPSNGELNTGLLIQLTGIAILIDAMFAPTFEQHFTGLFLVMLLGAGVVTRRDQHSQSDP